MWERGGQTTRSFDHWANAERQLRAFFRFGLKFGDEGLARVWNEIEQRPSDGSEDTIDVFDRELDGLGPHEFGWMVGAAVVRDAVTLYEVYLEQAAREILQWHALEWATEESPRWRDLRRFYKFIGVDLYADAEVRAARRLRHLLTHRRGALETDEDRAAYGSDFPFAHETVDLGESRVIETLNALAASARRIDPVAYEYSWGRRRATELDAMRAALPSESDE